MLVTGSYHIACVAHRAQQWALELRIDLLPQLADVDIDDIGLRIEVIIPDIFQQHGARDDLVFLLQQTFKKAEFPWLQWDRFAGAGD